MRLLYLCSSLYTSLHRSPESLLVKWYFQNLDACSLPLSKIIKFWSSRKLTLNSQECKRRQSTSTTNVFQKIFVSVFVLNVYKCLRRFDFNITITQRGGESEEAVIFLFRYTYVHYQINFEIPCNLHFVR